MPAGKEVQAARRSLAASVRGSDLSVGGRQPTLEIEVGELYRQRRIAPETRIAVALHIADPADSGSTMRRQSLLTLTMRGRT
jgi:hypothetical protein